MKRLILVLGILLISGVLSSCAKVVIKDGEWCGLKGSLGASCFHTLSDGSRSLTKAEWDSESIGMVCTKAENFGEWKKALLKLCDETGMCAYKVIETVKQLDSKAQKSIK